MADDYVRETLRALARRTGDSYVPLSEVRGYLLDRARSLHRFERYSQAKLLRMVADEIERRWGPGPRCERCGGTGMVEFGGEEPWLGGSAPCDCGAARG